MKYIIDGYNLFFWLESEINPLEKKRESFVETLNEALQSSHLHAILIFDSHNDHAAIFPSKRLLTALEIIFSPVNTSADAYILERLAIEKHPQTQIIVTSDKELSFQAKQLGAKTKSIEAFFEMLLKKRKKAKEEKKMKTESSYNYNRLLEAFEKKLKE